jgi:hypothetical protein
MNTIGQIQTSSKRLTKWMFVWFQILRDQLRGFDPNSVSPSDYFRMMKKQRGSALIMAAIFMTLATMLITVGVRLVSDSSTPAKKRTMMVAEAENIARAGLTDALGWYRRQTSNNGLVSAFNQTAGAVVPGTTPTYNTAPTGSVYSGPDQAFWPQNNTASGQSVADTTEPWIGLVHEYPLDSPVTATAHIWGRYEVAKVPLVGALTPTPTFYAYAVHDISGERDGNSLVNGDGAVWSITATAYVYRRMDFGVANGMWVVPYNKSPNIIIANTRVSTELAKLQLNMPTTLASLTAPVYVLKTSTITLGNNCWINGAVSAVGNWAVISMTPN